VFISVQLNRLFYPAPFQRYGELKAEKWPNGNFVTTSHLVPPPRRSICKQDTFYSVLQILLLQTSVWNCT